MSGTKCDIKNQIIEDFIDNDIHKEQYLEENSKVNLIKDEGKEIIEEIHNDYTKGQFIDEGLIDEYIIKRDGKLSEKKKLAILIHSLMSSNEALAEYMHEFILEHIGANKKVGTAIKYKGEDEKGKPILEQQTRQLELSRLSIASLRVIYNEALEPSRSKDGFGLFSFNGIFSFITLPKQRGKKEKSGGFWTVQQAVSNYADRVAFRVDKFMSVMKDILDDVENLAEYPLQTLQGRPELKRNYMRLFSMYMQGRLIMVDGAWMLNADWGPVRGDDGKPVFHDNGDVVYSWQNPIPLHEYTPPNKNKGDWYIEMSPSILDEFLTLSERARKIDDALFEYMSKNMEKSLNELEQELKVSFPNLSDEAIDLIFYKGKTEHPKTKENLLKGLSKSEIEEILELQKIFQFSRNDEFIIANGGKVEYMKNHWPALYNIDIFKPMLDTMIKDLSEIVDYLGEIVKTGKDDEGNTLKATDLLGIRKELAVHQSKLNYAINIKENLDDYPVDLQSNIAISFAKDNKYFKRISRGYNLKAARTDAGVYADYLTNIMSTIERNHLTSRLIKGLRMSRTVNSVKMHNAVSSAAINLFKVPFHSTDIYRKGFFTNLFGTGVSIDDINWFLNRIPGFPLLTGRLKLFRDRTALQLNKTFRSIASYITFAYLSGLGTTVQNFGDVLRNGIQVGVKPLVDAVNLYSFSSNEVRQKIERIIEQSGITQFSDFFSRAMVNSIIDAQLEADVQDVVLKAMMDFQHTTRNIPAPPEAQDYKTKTEFKRVYKAWSKKFGKKWNEAIEKFDSKVNKVLALSETFMTPEDYRTDALLTPAEIKQRRSEIRQRKRVMATNKMVQFAIEKKFEFKSLLRQTPWTKFRRMTAEVAVKSYIAASSIGGLVTMSSTEKFIRSIGFVIGVQRAWKAGLLNPNKKWWEYTDTRDIMETITIGRSYSMKMNFALSTQGTGEYNYNSLGNLMGKFKFWAQQKFSYDKNLFKEAYTSMKSLSKIKSNSFDFAAIFKMMGMMFKKGIRQTHPEVAALRAFMLTQLPLTIVADMLALGLMPAGVPFVRQLFYYGSGSKSLRGFTSDFVSLIAFPLVYLPMLLSGGADEEDIEKTAMYMLRKTWWGFVPMYAFDFIVSMMLAVGKGTNDALETIWDKSEVLRGGRLVPIDYKFLKEAGAID